MMTYKSNKLPNKLSQTDLVFGLCTK